MKTSNEVRARMAQTNNTTEYVFLRRLFNVLVAAGK